MYTITVYHNGESKTYRLKSLEKAVQIAAEIFHRTGVIVAIEKG